MKRICVMALFAIVLVAMTIALPATAATKYNPCSLLTSAELEAALRAKVASSDERDIPITEGMYKGEIMSTCRWVMGSIFVTLNIIRGPRTPQERAASLAHLQTIDEELKKRGWTVVPANIAGAACSTYKPPASESDALQGAHLGAAKLLAN